jgi:hypothetical protein
MKKIYEQPEIGVYKIKMNSICVLPQSLEDFLHDDEVADEGGETLTRRRTFLDGVDEVDWDLGF